MLGQKVVSCTIERIKPRFGTYSFCTQNTSVKGKKQSTIWVGEDDYVGVLTSPRFLRDNGIDIPAKEKTVVVKSDEKADVKADEKPEVKKKK
jgi:hypothetical protein